MQVGRRGFFKLVLEVVGAVSLGGMVTFDSADDWIALPAEGLQAHLSGIEHTVLKDGDPIAVWLDRSGKGRHAIRGR